MRFTQIKSNMKTTRITNYDSTLSVEDNAKNNNVTPAAIRSYIQSRSIDRATERKLYLYDKIRNYASEHPGEKAPKIAEALRLAANTVRRYLKMAEPPQPKEKKVTTFNQTSKLRFLSVSNSQTEILKTILAIHLPKKDKFQCDLTAWKLGFYKNGLKQPTYCYDMYASKLNDKRVKDLTTFETDWSNGTFNNIVIDLPCSVKGPTNRRYDISAYFTELEELLSEHKKMLQLAHRKLQTDGILVYKTMDFTYNNAPYWLSDEVIKMANETGFDLIDKYIYIDPKHSKIDRRRTRFNASVPAHAYFFVFKKRKGERLNNIATSATT